MSPLCRNEICVRRLVDVSTADYAIRSIRTETEICESGSHCCGSRGPAPDAVIEGLDESKATSLPMSTHDRGVIEFIQGFVTLLCRLGPSRGGACRLARMGRRGLRGVHLHFRSNSMTRSPDHHLLQTPVLVILWSMLLIASLLALMHSSHAARVRVFDITPLSSPCLSECTKTLTNTGTGTSAATAVITNTLFHFEPFFLRNYVSFGSTSPRTVSDEWAAVDRGDGAAQKWMTIHL